MTKRFTKAIIPGIVSGLFLAVFFKLIEKITNLKVYALLLNVDYIPYLQDFSFPEVIEVLFHIIVSIVLVACLSLLFTCLKVVDKRKIIFWSSILCLGIGLALFPTTSFSDRTPELFSLPSLLFWLIGHLGYGWLVGVLIYRGMK